MTDLDDLKEKIKKIEADIKDVQADIKKAEAAVEKIDVDYERTEAAIENLEAGNVETKNTQHVLKEIQLPCINNQEERKKKYSTRIHQLSEQKNKLLDKVNKLLDKVNKLLDKENKLLDKEKQLREDKRKLEDRLCPTFEPPLKKLKPPDITTKILDNIYTLVDKLLPRSKPKETQGVPERLPVTFNYDNIKNLLDKEWIEIFPRPISIFGTSPTMLTLIQQDSSPNIKSLFNCKEDASSVLFDFYINILNLIEYENIDPESSESTYSSCISPIIKSPLVWFLKKRNQTLNYKIESDLARKTTNLNSCFSTTQASDSMMTYSKTIIENDKIKTVATLRPDMAIKDIYTRFGLKGQHKPNITQAGEAKEQLIRTYFPLLKDLYLGIDHTFAYIAVGKHVELYLVEHKETEVILHDLVSFDLVKLEHRIKLFLDMILIFEMIIRMFDMYIPNIHNIKMPKINSIKLTGQIISQVQFEKSTNTILKYYYLCDSRHDHKTLAQFYQKLETLSPQNHLIQVIDYAFPANGPYRIKMTPICRDFAELTDELVTLNESIREGRQLEAIKKCFSHVLSALECIHELGFVHSDIRWPNIVYDALANTFRLIDFENVLQINGQCTKHNYNTESKDIGKDNQKYIISDIHKLQKLMVGDEIREIVKSNLSILQLFHILNDAFELITNKRVLLPELNTPYVSKIDKTNNQQLTYREKIDQLKKVLLF